MSNKLKVLDLCMFLNYKHYVINSKENREYLSKFINKEVLPPIEHQVMYMEGMQLKSLPTLDVSKTLHTFNIKEPIKSITCEEFLDKHNYDKYVVENTVENVNKLSRAKGLYCQTTSHTYDKYLYRVEPLYKKFKSRNNKLMISNGKLYPLELVELK